MICSPDKHRRLDGTALRIMEQVDTDLPIVPITRIPDFEFNEELYKLDKYVLADFCEYDHDANLADTHFFGKNTQDYETKFCGEQWAKFDQWVKDNSPLVYLKRELLRKDCGGNVYSLEYPSFYDAPVAQTKEQFDSRPIQVFNFWGLSNPCRPRIHGEIWSKSAEYDYVVGDNFDFLGNFLKEETNPKKWVTINLPHYNRVPMESVLAINGLAKLSLCLPGAGIKCFRHSESPLNSVMAKYADQYAWSFPWENGINCIEIRQHAEIEDLNNALNNERLYEIYLESLRTMDEYRIDNYVNHLKKNIDAHR